MDDNHLLLQPFVDEGATTTPIIPPQNDDVTSTVANTSIADDAMSIDTASSNNDDHASDTDSYADPNDNADETDDPDENTSNNDSNVDAEGEDDDAEGEPDDEEDNTGLSSGDNAGPDTDDDLTSVSHGHVELLHDAIYPDDTPPDSLQAVIHRTSPTYASSIGSQRDAFAKNSINPEVTDANILSISPEEHHPGTQRYHMRSSVPPRFQQGFNIAITCTQITAKEGLRRFGKDAEEALMREWLQLDKLEVYYGVFASSLTHHERRQALRLIQLIKLK